MVAVHDTALTINGQHPISITVEGEAHRRLPLDHGPSQGIQLGGTTGHIDLCTIGLTMQNGEVCTQRLKCLSGAGRGGTPAKVQHDGHAIEPGIAHRRQQFLPVAIQQIHAGS